MLGIQSSPKDESGVSAREAALATLLSIIPATKKTYLEAAVTPTLERKEGCKGQSRHWLTTTLHEVLEHGEQDSAGPTWGQTEPKVLPPSQQFWQEYCQGENNPRKLV